MPSIGSSVASSVIGAIGDALSGGGPPAGQGKGGYNSMHLPGAVNGGLSSLDALFGPPPPAATPSRPAPPPAPPVAAAVPPVGVRAPLQRAFVIRRNLDMAVTPEPWMHLLSVAHSGLLLLTSEQRWYVLEYTKSGAGTGVVLVYEAKLDVLRGMAGKMADVVSIQPAPGSPAPSNSKVYEWTKQRLGSEVHSGWTTELAEMQMIAETHGLYSILTNEQCHAAQEKTMQKLQSASPP
jgi:hypothetical protein